jgi:hypothetical protein
VLTQTGIGTIVESGKQRIEVDGRIYLLEIALRADFALAQAFLADYLGNLMKASSSAARQGVVGLPIEFRGGHSCYLRPEETGQPQTWCGRRTNGGSLHGAS